MMLHSTLAPEHSMTAYDGAAPAHGLALALVWWPVAFVLAVAYFIVVMRNYRGKVATHLTPLICALAALRCTSCSVSSL